MATLRLTLPADTPTLLALTAGTGVFQPHEVETLEEVFADYFREGDDYGHLCCTALDGEAIIGFIYLAPVAMTDRTWELWWIVVDAARQGQGLGTRLLAQAEHLVRQQQGRVLFIETSSLPHYAPTQKFYLKHGYQLVATLPDFYADGDSKLVYRKAIEALVV
jgi:ribosomal protein S18 acetylase RimI-like enzyme